MLVTIQEPRLLQDRHDLHIRTGRAAQPNPPAHARAVLREHGVTPGRVEAEIVRLSGGAACSVTWTGARWPRWGPTSTPCATIGASFGREALTHAVRAAHRKAPWFDLPPRSGAWRDGVFLRHGPDARQALISVTRQARARDAARPAGVEDLALALSPSARGWCPDPVGTWRARASIEHGDPAPLPPGKLTRQPSPAQAGHARVATLRDEKRGAPF